MAVSTTLMEHRAVPLLESHARTNTPTSEAKSLDEVWIAVMGVTGAGKSKFISACSGKDVKVGYSLESCTTEIDDYSFQWKNKLIHLIDTPGFDDTYRSDREVLEGIATWLATAYEQKIKLSGIIYLHRVTDPRVGGTSLRNLVMFKKLCGEDFYPRVFLVTTMWDIAPSKTDAIARETELKTKSDFWARMVERGATVERHWGSRESAMTILTQVVQNRTIDAPTAVKVQKEMVDEHKRLDQTMAGQQFEAELLKQREKHEKEIKAMKQEIEDLLEMNEKKAAAETERQRAMFEKRIAQSFDDQAKLKSSLEDIQKRQAAELQKVQEQAQHFKTAYEEKIRLLEKEKNELNRMDSKSSAARNLRSKIQQDEADVAQTKAALDESEKTLGKKFKRYCIKSKEWFQKHPDIVSVMVKTGIRYAIIAVSS